MSKIVVVSNIKQHIRTFLQQALKQHPASISTDVQHYLIELLCRFIKSESANAGFGYHELPTIALPWERAQKNTGDEQLKTLQHLGDVCLYTTGCFADSLRSRGMSQHYYIHLGTLAYRQLATLLKNDPFGNAKTYEQLSRQFGHIVEVLQHLSLVEENPKG